MTVNLTDDWNRETTSKAKPDFSPDDLWRECSAQQIPVSLSETGAPAFQSTINLELPRTLVASIPKSGTYLYVELLSRLGLTWTGIHARVDGFTDYRVSDRSAQLRQHEKLQHNLPWDAITRLTGPGQFLVGHIPREAAWENCMDQAGGFRIIFSCRNLRDCLVSQMRFFSDTGRHSCRERGWGILPDSPEKLHGYLQFHGAFLLEDRAQSMLGWSQAPDVLLSRYEELVGDFGRARQLSKFRHIARYLSCDETLVTDDLITSILGTKTMTSTGRRSRYQAVWDDQAEDFFRQHGGIEMNQILGYEQ